MYEELTDQDLVWHITGYLGSLENKLRHDRTFWGVPPSDENVSSMESLKLAIPKHILERAGAHARDYVCATGVLRAWQQVRASSFEVYLNVTDLHLLDAPSVRLSRREELATLQTLKVLAGKRTAFPKTSRPTVSVIHSRSQEAQVYEDFRQPFRSLDGAAQFELSRSTDNPELIDFIRREKQ